jgi:hypothetical protein
VSVAVKGPSSGGKSYTVERTLDFFPGQAYHALTAMSDRALAYSKEPLQHRMLVLYEAAGSNSDPTGNQDYMIRSLLSEGHIRYETVGSSSGKTARRASSSSARVRPDSSSRPPKSTCTRRTRRGFSVSP